VVASGSLLAQARVGHTKHRQGGQRCADTRRTRCGACTATTVAHLAACVVVCASGTASALQREAEGLGGPSEPFRLAFLRALSPPTPPTRMWRICRRCRCAPGP
jgi:hypothetical protein